jgi:hypothetical protein
MKHNIKASRIKKSNQNPCPDGIPSAETATYRDCLEQADICCEQARAAARLKRFTAALGLFRTAQSLYNRAITLGGDACQEAKERLQNLSTEMAAYGEMARVRAVSTTLQPSLTTMRDTRLPLT